MKRNKVWIIPLVLFLILILTNPSKKSFQEYRGDGSSVRRVNNFLIYSIYEDETHGEKYAGLLMNFFKIKTPEPNLRSDSTTVSTDSRQNSTQLVKDSVDNSVSSAKEILGESEEQVLSDFNHYMNFNYPDWKLVGKPLIEVVGKDNFKIRFICINPVIHEKEVKIARISYFGDRYFFTLIRGSLY